MIEVPLTKGKVSLVDDIDSDLSNVNWYYQTSQCHKLGYAQRTARRRHVWMHRVILERILSRELLSSETVDHINCNSLDNRRSNLRLADQYQQKANTPKQSSSNGLPTYSRYKGVTWYRHISKWAARIQCHNVERHLGVFSSEFDAAKAYDRAARECFGEFAKLNFPDNLVTTGKL
jgi:hypothetical protein